MTRTSLALLFVAALVAPSLAQPGDRPAHPPAPVARVASPSGWLVDKPSADRVAAQLGNEDLFAGVPISVDAQAWTSPTPGALLIGTQVTTELMPVAPAASASAALHATRAGADAVTDAKVSRWDVTIDPAGKLHEARLEWSDPTVGTTVLARTLVFRTGGALVRIGGECILGPDAAGLRAACEAALASIAPIATALEPVAVSATPPVAVEPAPPPTSTPTPTPDRDRGSAAPGIRAREGEIPATIMVRPAPKQTDRRPYYLLGGVVILGLVFWWNRREREQREAAERAEEARRARRERGRGKDAAAGDDAAEDDAAAAADGGADDGADAADAGADDATAGADDATADAEDAEDAKDAKRPREEDES
ncbi:MAG: hypothetical protein IPL61_24145 [Myxococcales bacterium]|nr:hypothetical protein [Myxococcales bacterium]